MTMLKAQGQLYSNELTHTLSDYHARFLWQMMFLLGLYVDCPTHAPTHSM
jgi:hypothetical protein